MHPNRKIKREDLEATLRFRSRQETLSAEDLIEERLTHLQIFIGQLKRTPHGLAEIEGRTKRFGDCERIEGETADHFYGKLAPLAGQVVMPCPKWWVHSAASDHRLPGNGNPFAWKHGGRIDCLHLRMAAGRQPYAGW